MRQTVIKLGEKLKAMSLDQICAQALNDIYNKESKLNYRIVNNIENTRWDLDIIDFNCAIADYFWPHVSFKLDYNEYSYLFGIMTAKYNDYRKFIADKIGFDLSEPMN